MCSIHPDPRVLRTALQPFRRSPDETPTSPSPTRLGANGNGIFLCRRYELHIHRMVDQLFDGNSVRSGAPRYLEMAGQVIALPTSIRGFYVEADRELPPLLAPPSPRVGEPRAALPRYPEAPGAQHCMNFRLRVTRDCQRFARHYASSFLNG